MKEHETHTHMMRTATAELTPTTDRGFYRMENFGLAQFFHTCVRACDTHIVFLSYADLLVFILRLLFENRCEYWAHIHTANTAKRV